jgi:hypothetical protein
MRADPRIKVSAASGPQLKMDLTGSAGPPNSSLASY